MADISKITLPNGASYDFKDSVVRAALETKAEKALYGDTTINVGRLSGSTVGDYSTAEGKGTTASGNYSHAEGAGTGASGNYSHAEGCATHAHGDYSHAEGLNSQSNAAFSHAGGFGSYANGVSSFAHGEGVVTNNNCETAFGKSNLSSSNTIFSIGDGTVNARHNAFEITTTGGKLHGKEISTTQINVRDMTLLFGEITWTKSGAGKYYTSISVPNVTKIISVCITDPWGEFLDSDIVQPIAIDTSVQLMCNTNKNYGTISLRITYI